MQYTGHTDYTKQDPPTYVCVGEDDGIANWRTTKRRLDALSAAGVDTQFHLYPDLRHGFGLASGRPPKAGSTTQWPFGVTPRTLRRPIVRAIDGDDGSTSMASTNSRPPAATCGRGDVPTTGGIRSVQLHRR
jgi:acetyl esterase/lipase